MKVGQHQGVGKTKDIEGIKKREAVERFLDALNVMYEAQKISDKGPYVLAHVRVVRDGKKFDIIVFNSSKIRVTRPSSVDANAFDEIAVPIFDLARKSTISIKEARQIYLQRAKDIIDYISSLDLENEKHRMVVVILSDTSNEIVITERMKYFRIEGSPLESNLPDKIRLLRDNKKQPVYKEDTIKQVRGLRNQVVHQGNIPLKEQAQEAIKIAKDIFDHS